VYEIFYDKHLKKEVLKSNEHDSDGTNPKKLLKNLKVLNQSIPKNKYFKRPVGIRYLPYFNYVKLAVLIL
jgi:hypothetical protein